MEDSQAILARLGKEFTERRNRGESPNIEEYAARHPELAEEIRRLFSTLLLMEQSADEPPGEVEEPVDGMAPTVATPRPASGLPAPEACSRLASSAPEAPPSRFGDYDLLEKIASGGMGVVYRARQRSLNRIVALKRIKAGQLASDEEVLRFQAEAEAAANLAHPNIVAIHEVGEAEGQHYFSMDYIEGKTLADLVAGRETSFDTAAEYVQTIAVAIAYAHEQGIVHRDLKPSNVMIDSSGRIKVADFGLAKRITGGTDLTTSGSALGSPPYMSPEQAAGKKDQIGKPTDVYALGAILYELVTGRPPFQADTPLETLYQVMETEPTAPRLVDREIPHDLETICLKCMAKEPADRYASAQEAADELGRYLNGEAILARPLGTSGGSLWLTWAILGAIFLALGFAYFTPGLAASRFVYLGGQAFLRLLKMIVVPLVMVSVMSGVLGVGDVRRLGRPGGVGILYFVTTTVMAILVGLLVVNLVQPGTGAFTEAQLAAAREEAKEACLPGCGSEATEPDQAPGLGDAFESLVFMLCADNLFGAMAEGNLLPLIVFSIVFAGMLTTMGRRAETISRVIVGANHALLNFVMLLMKIAPIGIFCLVAAQFGEAVGDETLMKKLASMAYYMLTVLSGLGLHCFVTLPLVLFLLTGRNPFVFLLRMSEALLTAFSTASSSATLPVSMECAEKRARVSRRATEFVFPLGATVNMDGTALYQGCAAVFIAQAFGMSLGPVEQATIVLTATLAAVAAAGIPQAGLFTLLIVLNAINVPLEGIALILSVDWLLDRFRTTVNVFGDAVGAAVVQRSFQRSRKE